MALAWAAMTSGVDEKGERVDNAQRRADPVAASQPSARSGTLVLAAAPIGRPDDASARLVAALASAQVIAAEDTRRLRRLAAALGVTLTGRVISYYDSVEADRTPGRTSVART